MYYDPNMHVSLPSQVTRRIKELEAGWTMSMGAAKREDQVEVDDVEPVIKKVVKKPATQTIVPEKNK